MTRKPPPAKPTWRPHLYQADPDTPDVCRTCRNIRSNGAHVGADQLPAPDPETRAITARITGEHRED